MTDSLDQALTERFAFQRDELPSPDFADVLRRATQITTRPLPRKGPREHRRRRIRPVLATALVVGVLAGAGVGIAAGVGAFEGTPAPPGVSTSFKLLDGMAGAATKQGFAHAIPQADASKAHGVIQIPTADGPEDLWAAPNDQGGQCYFIDWADDAPMQDGSMYGFAGCPPPPTKSEPISADGPVWGVGHPDLMTITGVLAVDAATVQVTFHDGSTMTLPVVERFFLGSIDRPRDQMDDVTLKKVVAFDNAGNQVAEWLKPTP